MDGNIVALTIVAAYDISEDSRRAQVSARLQEYGDRVQKSVFVIHVSPEDLQLLASACEGVMDLDTSPSVCWVVM